jgi:hypothetical protein
MSTMHSTRASLYLDEIKGNSPAIRNNKDDIVVSPRGQNNSPNLVQDPQSLPGNQSKERYATSAFVQNAEHGNRKSLRKVCSASSVMDHFCHTSDIMYEEMILKKYTRMKHFCLPAD